jgi:phage-related protein
MTFQTFNPTPPPSPGTRIVPAYRVLLSKFGDGYEQRSVDGINAIGLTAYLKWDNLLVATEQDPITSFFDATNGVTPFYWTPPGYTSPLKWVVDTSQQNSYQITPVTSAISSLTVTLRQVFDLDT